MGSVLADVGREELWQMVEDGEELVLVDALPPISFAASHLPGAINIPPATEDERAPAGSRIRGRDRRVLHEPDLLLVGGVANRLVELGYRNVRHYPGGKERVDCGGVPLEGGRA